MSKTAVAVLCIAGGILVGGLALVVVGFQSGDIKLSSLLPAGSTETPQFRASFIDSTKKSCISTSASRAPTLGTEKIEAYCNCFSEGAVELLTEDDVRYMIDHIGSLPPSLLPKLQPVIAQCRSQALGNG